MRAQVTSVAAWAAGMAAAAALGTLLGGCSSGHAPVVASGPAPGLAGLSASSGAFGATGSSATGASSGSGKAGGLSGGGAIGHNDLGKGSAGTGPGYHDSRITLPETVGLSFFRPKQADWTEHEVLSTVQQALRAQLHSENIVSGSSTDPLLSVYWSAPALTAAQGEIAAWVKKGQQPVGVLIITGTAYTAPDTSGKSVVTYCANWSDDVADADAGTRAARSAEPPPAPISDQGMYTTLTLARADRHHWRVQSLVAKADSANCQSSKTG